jgi:hypothetical protein
MSTIPVRSTIPAAGSDQSPLHRRLEEAWRLNEAMGAGLEAAMRAEPAAASMLAEDYARRRRILYVHLQAIERAGS